MPPQADRLRRGSCTPPPPRCQPASASEGRRRVRCLDMRLTRTANALQPLPGASPDGSPARAFQVSPQCKGEPFGALPRTTATPLS